MRALVIFIAAAVGMGSVQATAQSVAQESTLVANMKCRDLIGPGKDDMNTKNVLIFGEWASGYMAGVSSASPVNLTQHLKLRDFEALVLTECSTKPDYDAVEAAVDAASLAFNLLNLGADTAVDLKSPGRPAE